MSRLQGNSNLTILNQEDFNGWKVLSKYTMVNDYLMKIDQVLQRALKEHPRTIVIRFDLHFPSIPNCPDYPLQYDSTVITRFIESFKAQVKADLMKKSRDDIRVHSCTVRYIWAKEKKDTIQHHYHIALLLNKDTYFSLGSYSEMGNNLSSKIVKAWASALWINLEEMTGLVHFPDAPFYHLSYGTASFGNEYQNVFRRLSYLAKSETKFYGDGSKNFSCSQR